MRAGIRGSNMCAEDGPDKLQHSQKHCSKRERVVGLVDRVGSMNANSSFPTIPARTTCAGRVQGIALLKRSKSEPTIGRGNALWQRSATRPGSSLMAAEILQKPSYAKGRKQPPCCLHYATTSNRDRLTNGHCPVRVRIALNLFCTG